MTRRLLESPATIDDGGHAPPVAHAPASPFRALHRNLQGRYRWAILLGAIGAAAGAFLGYRSETPLYRCEGLVYIRPTMPSPQDPAGLNVLPMFSGFVGFQVQMLESLSTTHLAMETEAWKATREGMSPQAVAQFIKRRAIVHMPDAPHIQIQFTDPDPDVAVAGVAALIAAYQNLSKEENRKNDSLNYVTTQTEVLTAELKDGADTILKLSAEYGGVEGLELRHSASVSKVLATEEDLAKAQALLRDLEKPVGGGETPPKTPREIAVESATMADMLLHLDLLEKKEKRLQETAGDENPELATLRDEIAVRKSRIEKFAEDWDRSAATGTKASKASKEEFEQRSRALALRVEMLQARLAALREESKKLGKARVEVGQLRVRNEDVGRRLEQMKALQDQVSSQLVGKGRITIADPGTRPTTPLKDSSKTRAALGFVGGGGVGVLLVLLLGLRNRKFRTTEDVGSSLARLKLLGLVPVLREDPSDLVGAEVAAHCVHQIRAMLQLGHPREELGCICVTGPGVGSGKTTISLALGLSFARSGSRTLLVDADLTGRGLTRRIGRMLLQRARAIAGDVETSAPAWGDPRDVRALLPSLALSSGADLERVDPGMLTDLFDRAVARLGLPGVRDSELLTCLFAVTDLVLHGEGREVLASHVSALAAASNGHGEGVRIPPRISELDASAGDVTSFDRVLFPTPDRSLKFLPLRGLGVGGAVSVATISKILERLRGEFDVVLIDTGPVSGSIETPMVAASADAVVFVVSPEDRRPDAEEAVERLIEVRAPLAGVVFNRAAPREVLKVSGSRSLVSGGTRAQ